MDNTVVIEHELLAERKKCSALAQELSDTKDQLLQLQTHSHKLAEQHRIEQLKLIDHNRSLQNDLESCADSLEECLKAEEALKGECRVLQQLCDSLTGASEQATQELTACRQQLAHSNQRCSHLEMELEDLQIDLDSAHIHIKELAAVTPSKSTVKDESEVTERPLVNITATSVARASRKTSRAKECQTDTSMDEILRVEVAKRNVMCVQIEELKVEVLNLNDAVLDRQEELDLLRISLRDANSLRNENEELEMELSEKDAIIASDQKTLHELEERIANFELELTSAVSEQQAVIAQRDTRLQQCEDQIAALNITILQLQNDHQKTDIIEELQSRVLDLNIKLESFRNVLSQKDQQLDALINKRRDAQNFKDRNLLMVIEEKKEEIGKLNLKVYYRPIDSVHVQGAFHNFKTS